MKTKWEEHLCIDCGEVMVRRQNKSGDSFMGCSAFPECKYTEELEYDDGYEDHHI